MSELTLEALIEAAQSAGSDGNAPTADESKAVLGELFSGAKLGRESVDALQGEALEAYKALKDKPAAEVTDEDMTGLEILATVIESTRDAQESLDAAEQARIERLEALDQRVIGSSADPAPEGGEPGAETPAEDPAAEAQEPAADPAPEGGEPSAPEGGQAQESAPAEPALTASARPRRTNWRLGDAARRAPKVETPASVAGDAGLDMVAASDVRDFHAGQKLDGIADLATAAQNRIDVLPFGSNGVSKGQFAKIKVPFPAELTGDKHTSKLDDAIVAAAVDQSRLEGGDLVAAGGWCAPSERFYELSPLLASDSAGLVSMPEVAVPRGGIETTEGADFSAIWAADVGKVQTEAQAIAGTSKVFYRVPCTEFDETRADVIYTGIEASILQNNTYPELTQQYVAGALVAHARRINLESIKRMVAKSGSVIDLTGVIGASAATSLLNGVELQIMDARYKFRTPENFPMEAVAPIWLKMAIRSDLALRAGVNFMQVTDAQIDGFFRERGANVQWVYDWQDAYDGTANGFGGAAAKTAFPTTVEMLVYPAGTFVRGRGAVIQLEAVYDSALLEQNEYLALFTEEKLLVHKRQYSSRRVRFPVAVNGVVGAAMPLDGNGKVIPETP